MKKGSTSNVPSAARSLNGTTEGIKMTIETETTKTGFTVNLSGMVALSMVITAELIILHIFGVI